MRNSKTWPAAAAGDGARSRVTASLQLSKEHHMNQWPVTFLAVFAVSLCG